LHNFGNEKYAISKVTRGVEILMVWDINCCKMFYEIYQITCAKATIFRLPSDFFALF